MTKAYCIIDKSNGRIVQPSLGLAYINTKKLKYANQFVFDKYRATHMLNALKNNIKRRQDSLALPKPSRFTLKEISIIPTTKDDAQFFRIKDTANGKYILGRDLERYCASADIGKLYNNYRGVQLAFSKYTGTPIRKRQTKAQKILMGTKKACQYEIEPVKLVL